MSEAPEYASLDRLNGEKTDGLSQGDLCVAILGEPVGRSSDDFCPCYILCSLVYIVLRQGRNEPVKFSLLALEMRAEVIPAATRIKTC